MRTYPPPEERFWSKVDRRGDDECWPWLAGTEGGGYGQLRIDGQAVAAHRFAYELLVGPIPEGLYIDHLCRVRTCVNPAHMEPVTNAENILRGTSPSAIHARMTHCTHGHPFEGENLIIWFKDGKPRRRCRTCARSRPGSGSTATTD